MDEKTLYLQSSGPQVSALHVLLKKYDPQLAVDSSFSPKTEHAVRAAQRKLGVFPADGLADPYTLAMILKAVTPAPASVQAAPAFGTSPAAIALQAASTMMAAAQNTVISNQAAERTISEWIAGLHPVPIVVPPVPANL